MLSQHSMSTISKDDNMVLSSEDSSSPDDSEIELGLGLCLGLRDSPPNIHKTPIGGIQFRRILTAEDFPSSISSSSSSSSTSSVCSSSSLRGVNLTDASNTNSDSAPTVNGGSSQVVGWPPIRASRISTLVNQAKPHSVEEFKVDTGKDKNKHQKIGVLKGIISGKDQAKEESRNFRNSVYVKVNMDGVLIGRKVNLSAHSSYETLALTVENMFLDPTALVNSTGSSIKEHDGVRPSRLLNGHSGYMLTYEDREGDWMLVGDVPWGMFTHSVKRLRIMRATELNQIGR
ncbi:auxin-responsive protein IAA11 isoform X2 [Cucumis sativus]|uniref:auxin-responsive protein IAA11 isoform X2 n=1 Tax=Cucumis sativus TaxID=3659 RepID=UPI0012F4E60F|nr:auxin-responsive protein IAA11 isoform X2 [Cucumis sativus]